MEGTMANRPNPRNRNGHRRRQAVARLRARRDPCALCGGPIDYDLPPGHPLSFECDEIVPVSLGGSPYDMDNLQAAHRICNQRRGNRTMESIRDEKSKAKESESMKASPATLPRSREW